MTEQTESITGLPPRAVQYETEGESPERTITQRTSGEVTLMMTEIEAGTFVGWDRCDACRQSVATCVCVGGPKPREVIDRWRQERLDKLAARQAPTSPAAPTPIDDSKLTDAQFQRLEELELQAASRYYELNELPDDADLPVDFDSSEFLEPAEADELKTLYAQSEVATDALVSQSAPTETATKVDSGLDAAKTAIEHARSRAADFDPGF